MTDPPIDPAGVFAFRRYLLESLPRVVASARKHPGSRAYLSLFGVEDEPAEAFVPESVLAASKHTDAALMAAERDVLGCHFTEGPLDRHGPEIAAFASHRLPDLGGLPDGLDVAVGGMVARGERKKTRAGKPMARWAIGDGRDEVAAVLWADRIAAGVEPPPDGSVAIFSGTVRRDAELATLAVRSIVPMDRCVAALATGLKVGDGVREPGPAGLAFLAEAARRYPGHLGLFADLGPNHLGRRVVRRVGSVRLEIGLIEALVRAVGPEDVRVVGRGGTISAARAFGLPDR